MTFWLVLAVTSLVAGLWLVRPFLRRGGVELAESERAMSVYRDQIDAVQRDSALGLVSNSERAEAEREIEGRALRAARGMDNAVLAPRRSGALAFALGVLVIAGSGALYWDLGSPGAPDMPLEPRLTQLQERATAAGVPSARAPLVEQTLAEDADSFEEWWAIALARTASGDHAASVEAYRKAAEASDDRPSVLSAYAEALTLANGNKVPAAAKIIFGQVLVRQPLDPRARYYTALGKAQAQDFEGALADWLALYGESALDAPWAPTVRRDIVSMARFTRTPLTQILPDALPEEIAFAASEPPSQPEASDASPVDRMTEIETALASQPKNFELSIELAGLYAASGQPDRAAVLLDAAKGLYPGAPFVQQRLNETARSLGLAANRGPTDADIASASEMTETERDEMVRGMVDGLAARLTAEPDDLEGWLMLIRSYAVLQDAENATQAVKNAYLVFDDRPQQLAAIRMTAAEFGIPLQ